MSRQPLRCLIAIFLLAATPTLLRAQSATEKPAVEFSCLVWEPLPFPAIFYFDGKSYLPLELSPGNRSKLYPLQESAALELYVNDVGDDGSETYKLIGQSPLLAGTRRMLFVIEPAEQSAGLPLTIFGIDDALDNFPPGTFKFLNFSKSVLQVKFGSEITPLPADEIRVVKSNAPKLGGFLPFMIGDARGNIVFETRLFGQPTGREIVFIGPPAKPGGPPRLNFVTQIIPPEPPNSAANP
jgi:hypothetical protein